MAASIRYGGIPAPGTGNGKVDFNNMRAPTGKLVPSKPVHSCTAEYALEVCQQCRPTFLSCGWHYFAAKLKRAVTTVGYLLVERVEVPALLNIIFWNL
jgi:hypothetical protein